MPPDPEALRSALDRDRPAALALLRDWVAINSFTYHRDGVNVLGRATADAFAPLGFTAEYVPCADRRCGDHLFLRRPGRTRATLLCVSHLDTVYPPEEEARQRFHWREAENRIYGPGIIDIKGGSALLWLQLRALRAAAPALLDHFTWILAFNSAEEVLGDDFAGAALARFGGVATAALVYEPGARGENEFNLVVARKGRAQFRVAVAGRGAHAGSRHAEGANAIAELARVIPLIEALTDRQPETKNSLLETSNSKLETGASAPDLTANVGLIRGGEALNRVPHEAHVEGELRAFDPAVLRDASAAILALAGPGHVAAASDGFRCRVHVEITGDTPAWRENEKTRRLFDAYARAAARLGGRVVAESRGGLSDGNFFSPHLPTLDGLGPAGGNGHTSEWSDDPAAPKRPEFLDPASLVPKALLNLLALAELAAEK